MQFATLWKRSCTGAILQWSIEVEGNKYRTHSGQEGGAITTTNWTTVTGKNAGKSNATSDEDQAFKDATSKWLAKQDRERYVDDVSQIDVITVPQPMLAHNFADRLNKISWKDGVYMSLKLNGARCIATRDGLFSRKRSRWVACPHIFDKVSQILKDHPDIIALDGEFFNEELRQDLGGLISLISKKAPTQEDLDYSEEVVKYYVYDVITTENYTYSKRLDIIKRLITDLNSSMIQVVDAELVYSKEDIDAYLSKVEEQGHEGVMIRLDGVYQHKRSNFLLKYKTFHEDEFLIVSVKEGSGDLQGKVGAFILRDSRGELFRAAPTGSHAYWEKMWSDRDNLLNKTATVKYKELTPIKNSKGGVPNFGKVVAIRDYED